MTKKGFYKRGWHHTKTRGKESVISCGFCGRKVPKYKTFSVTRGFRITDPVLRRELGRSFSLSQSKMYACPGCARHRNIVRRKK
jgi:ribosomal protein S26